MSDKVLEQLLRRIEEHAARHGLVDFPIVLHGGEPLLWGIGNFHRFATGCEAITSRTGCDIPIAVTTNGVLIDEAWLDCFEACDTSIAISLDGPEHIHDIHRRTFQGNGTHAAVERAARMLVARSIRVSALSVCNPAYPPQQYVDFFASCGIDHYDIMIPDATVDEKPASIAAFYNGLFDLWLEANRSKPTADIRIITDMITALLANSSATEGVGYQPVELCTVMDRWHGGGARRATDCGRRNHPDKIQSLRTCTRRCQGRATMDRRPRSVDQALLEVPELQVHERLRRRLSPTSLFQEQ
jgi:uncharacterized protein